MKVGYGAFDYRDKNASRAYLRNAFLLTIEDHAQKVLEDLHDESFQLYCQLEPDERELMWVTYHHLRWETFTERITKLVVSVKCWASRYHLNADWCLKIAIWTLPNFLKNRPDKLSFCPHTWGGGEPEIPPSPDGLPTLWYWSEDKKSYLERVSTQALRTIENDSLLRHGKPESRDIFVNSIIKKAEAYWNEVANYLLSLDYPQTEEKKKLERDLIWTVRFQVLGETFTKIADDAKVKDYTVIKQVTAILNEIGIPKRDDAKPGRPKGRPDSEDCNRSKNNWG